MAKDSKKHEHHPGCGHEEQCDPKTTWEEKAKIAGQTVREAVDDLSDRSGDMLHKTEEHVKKHPLQMIAAAFGLGVLLSRLFRRK